MAKTPGTDDLGDRIIEMSDEEFARSLDEGVYVITSEQHGEWQ